MIEDVTTTWDGGIKQHAYVFSNPERHQAFNLGECYMLIYWYDKDGRLAEDQLAAIEAECVVFGHDGLEIKRTRKRLGDENPVEWVAK